MLTTLQLQLKIREGKRLMPQMASAMHGVMMELIDEDYAEALHSDGLRPYSQFLSFNGDDVYWNINVLEDEAYRRIILPFMDEELKTVRMERHDMDIDIIGRRLHQVSESSLTEEFYAGSSGRYFKVRFETPTAFKQNGKYTFYPDLGCIYASLMRRYDFVNKKESFYDDDLLEELTANTSIIKYNLKSTSFHLEGTRIPSFVGWIVIRNDGPQTMGNFIRLLLRFGGFSGVGIKTGIGMGALQLIDREEKSFDK